MSLILFLLVLYAGHRLYKLFFKEELPVTQYEEEPESLETSTEHETNDQLTHIRNKETGIYLCPKCKENTLRYISGKNGPFWGCNNYPKCKATYDDKNGTPVLPMETPKYYDKYDYKEAMVKKWAAEQKEEPNTPQKYTKEDIYSLSWRQFEEWVTEVFKQHGYIAYATPPRCDGGKDVVAVKNGVKYFIECKHYQTEWIGREPLQKLIGAAIGENVHHVIFITTSNYHDNAREYAQSVNNTGNMIIELWDIDKILEMANK